MVSSFLSCSQEWLQALPYPKGKYQGTISIQYASFNNNLHSFRFFFPAAADFKRKSLRVEQIQEIPWFPLSFIAVRSGFGIYIPKGQVSMCHPQMTTDQYANLNLVFFTNFIFCSPSLLLLQTSKETSNKSRKFHGFLFPFLQLGVALGFVIPVSVVTNQKLEENIHLIGEDLFAMFLTVAILTSVLLVIIIFGKFTFVFLCNLQGISW